MTHPAINLTTEHEPTEACWLLHCYWHNLDEVATGYRSCGECGHSYPTKRALRREWRAGYPGPASLRDWVWRTWQLLTARVSKIYFCPLCMHDW